jgi:hypothetical protein
MRTLSTLTNTTKLKGFTIRARDGELGMVDQFYFDDVTWEIRCLTVKTAGCLDGRDVLISPTSVVHTDWRARRLDVALTKKQVQNSPECADSHLRSTEAITGYRIEATDGEIGHVDGFLVDDEAWAIRYLEVATRDWWPGKKVLVSPEWIQRLSWEDSSVYAGLSREAIRNAPEYFEAVRINREYEDRLHIHYGQPPYWMQERVPDDVPLRWRSFLPDQQL